MSDHVALASILLREKNHLAHLLDAHVQLRLLVEAGDTRYLGWAVDDLTSCTASVEAIETDRRTLTGTTIAEDWIESAPADLKPSLEGLIGDVGDLTNDIARERRRARQATHSRLATRARAGR